MLKNFFLGVFVATLLVSPIVSYSDRPDVEEIILFSSDVLQEPDDDEILNAPDVDESLTGENFEEDIGINIATVDTKQRECLAKAIYWEAKNQSIDGKLAVGLVVMNRVRSDQFGDTVCKVVYQGCQFSWVCNGKKKKNPGKSKNAEDREAWAESISLANELLLQYDSFKDITKGATYFHAKYVKPDWSRWKKMERTVRIEDHIFYRARSM